MKKYVILILLVALVLSITFVSCNESETGIKVFSNVGDTLTLYETQLDDLDYTKLFTITENGKTVEVLDEYLDLAHKPTAVGEGFVKLRYKDVEKLLKVVVIEPDITITRLQTSITLDTKQIKTFDFTTLFTIKSNADDVEVLDEYIDKYDLPVLPGKGSITLNYKGKSATIDVELVQAEKEIIVKPLEENVEIVDEEYADEEYATTKFTKLFGITEDGRYITVMKRYLTLGEIIDGKANVTCTYKEHSATLTVNIKKTIYELTLSMESIDINQTIVESYNYLSLFNATRNGEPFEITNEMVESNIENAIGEFDYTVTIGTLDTNKVSKTLKVNVVSAHDVYIVTCYNGVTIPLNEIDNYDYTQLFALYVDGAPTEVTLDMIDISALKTAVAGETKNVVLVYTIDDDTITKEAPITLADEVEVVIIGKNVCVDLNSASLNLTELFTIQQGDKKIDVAPDMISGTVDYNTAGDYTVICAYDGIQTTAIVTVTDGVIIGHRYGDTITILKGTNQDSYSFANDFLVTINGLTFTNLDACVDSSNVDFSKVGTYTASITVKYNTKKPSLGGVKFDTFTQTITYEVIDRVYSLTVPQDVVWLPRGTTSFNPLSELKLTINNKKQTLTTNPENESVIACYVEILSEDIDFAALNRQKVEVALYVYGADKEPVIAEYYVCIESEIIIQAKPIILFVGDVFYTVDLFNVIENGEEVEVDNTMVNGKINTLKTGKYKVSIEYKGIYKETEVVVYPKEIRGEYFTPMLTLPVEEEVDDEGLVVEDGVSAKPIGDLIVNTDSIYFCGVAATNIQFIDNVTMGFTIKNNDYVLHYDNGIIALDPDNSIKMGFSDYRRPLIYFNKSMYELKYRLELNSTSNYVLQSSVSGYSIDIFTMTNLNTKEEISYGLKVRLVSKYTSDTIYNVTWGEVTFAEDFVRAEGETSSLTFLDDIYEFTMSSAYKARTKKEVDSNMLLANKVFTGTMDGGQGKLSVSSNGSFTMYVDGVIKFSISSTDISNDMIYGGFDPRTNVLQLFSYTKITSTKPCFSVKLTLDLENNTFVSDEKTELWGMFAYDNKFIFLDGFGGGVINYNTSSYQKYKIAYTSNAGLLKIKYIDIDDRFPYGESASFSIDSFGNVLRIKDFYNQALVGESFENQYIESGAIIRIKSATVGKATSAAIGKAELENNITIITAEKELTGTDKTACFDYTYCRFTTAGFYKLGINVPVNGKVFQATYVVQVLDTIYKDEAIVGDYKQSMLRDGYSLNLDKWGRITLTTPEREYQSSYRIVGDNYYAKFVGSGYSFNVSGKRIADGIVSILSQGTLILNNYMTTGDAAVAATENLSVRKITIGENVFYYMSSTYATLGELMEYASISGTPHEKGNIFRLTKDGVSTIIRLNEWGKIEGGITRADDYYGTFTNNGNTMYLNGFGLVKFDGSQGEYRINNNKTITVTVNGNVYFYDIDLTERTYKISSMVLDNTILEGLTFSSNYMFGNEDMLYSVKTIFTFTENGVMITSNSSDYEEEFGKYSAVFATNPGEFASFSVYKNKVTIEFKEYTFVFEIDDVSNPTIIKTLSTTLPEDSPGYFGVGIAFSLI